MLDTRAAPVLWVAAHVFVWQRRVALTRGTCALRIVSPYYDEVRALCHACDMMVTMTQATYDYVVCISRHIFASRQKLELPCY